jgi:hypothetical protein
MRTPWTGAPGSPERTWAENDGAKPYERIGYLVLHVHSQGREMDVGVSVSPSNSQS